MAADNPTSLMAFSLGVYRWPPDPNEGYAIVKIGATYKLDPQKPHGKDDADIKGVGREARKVSLELHWTARIDSEARAFLLAVSPVGINQGKAWEFTHPDTDLYNVNSLELEKMGEITRDPGQRSVTLDGLSWIKKPPLKVGTGAKTATAAAVGESAAAIAAEGAAGAAPHVFLVTSDGDRIDMGNGPLTRTTTDGNVIGFNGGDDAPRAKVA